MKMRMTSSVFSKTSLAATVGCLLSLWAQAAAPIAYDDFNGYTTGTNVIGQSGGSGWNDSWYNNNSFVVEVVDGSSMTYNQGGVVRGGGNAIKIANDAPLILARNTYETPDTSGQTYFTSFIFQVVNNDNATGNIGNEFTHYAPVDGQNEYAAQSSTIGIIAKGGDAGVRNGGSSNQDLVDNHIQYATTYFAVVKYSGWDGSKYNTATLWLNPATTDESTSDPTIVASIDIDDTGSSGFGGLQIRSFYLADENSYFLLDDMRIGTDWDSVVTASIPEPATTGLLFGLCVLLLANRYKRSKSRR